MGKEKYTKSLKEDSKITVELNSRRLDQRKIIMDDPTCTKTKSSEEVGSVNKKKCGGYKIYNKEMSTLILLGWMIALFFLSLSGFLIMWFTDYFNDAILSQIILRNNSEAAANWITPNTKYDTVLKIYLFNYTNLKEYSLGTDRKLSVMEIGPISYREHTTKVNVQFNRNSTVTYRDHKKYTFLKDKSLYPEDVKLFLPNVPLLTAAVKVESMSGIKKFAAIQLLNGLNEEVFKRLSAFDFLWGYLDHIVALDFGKRVQHFGLLMNRNGTSADSLQINTGERDINKIGTITQFNGLSHMNFWLNDECNRIDGTEATMFSPRKVRNREILHVFLQVLCRKIPLKFEKEVSIIKDIKVLRYRTPSNVFANPRNNIDNTCYCDQSWKCLPNGIINATKCYNGAPIFPSFPHFYTSDPIVFKNLEGIRPQSSLHRTYADIHPRFAFPVNGASRIQINIGVHKNTLLRNKLRRFDEGSILPLIWIEISPGDYTDAIIDSLVLSTFGVNAVQFMLKYGTILTCIISTTIIVFVVLFKTG